LRRNYGFCRLGGARLKFCRYENQEIIYTEENYANQMYFITQGTVEFVVIRDSISFPYIEIVKNYFFGEVDLLFSEDKKTPSYD
jgi:hypothetical protein